MNPKILIVDDEALNRELLLGYLEGQGYHLLEADCAAAARTAIAKHDPDLVLLDVIMPAEDGFTLCAELKKNTLETHLPVILVTALADKQSRVHGLACGADDFLTKPVDRLELVVKVRNMLKIRALHKSLFDELLFAQQVQQNLFLADIQLQDNDRLVYEPCRRVGGDLIELWEQDGARWALIADASGHGPSAALIATAAKALIDRRSSTPAELLARLNSRLLQLLPGETPYHLTAACLCHRGDQLLFSGAGHPPVYLHSEGVHTLESRSIPLGVLPDQRYSDQILSVAPGGWAFLYSDGLLDLISEQALQVLIDQSASGDQLTRRLKELIAGQTLSDDISFLAMAL